MATRLRDPCKAEALRAVIRHLTRALEECHRLLAQAEGRMIVSGQDNAPGKRVGPPLTD